MGTAAQFSQALHKHTTAYAAWLPVANTFALGDYGLISDGAFTRIGHVREFGVEFDSNDPSPQAPISLTSEGARVVRIVGGVEITAMPDAPVDATLRIEFESATGFFVKAAAVAVTEIGNVRETAARLAETEGWKREWRVVRSLWTADDCTIAVSIARSAHFTLSGQASALAQFDVGGVSAGLTASSDHHVGFSLVGQAGVIGLGLFKLKRFRGSVRLLGSQERAAYETDTADELPTDL